MAKSKRMKEYEEHLALYKRKMRNYHALDITTGIVSPLWTCGISAGFLYWIFTTYMYTLHYAQIVNVLILTCICAACAVVCAMGIWTMITAIGWISPYSEGVSFGIYAIILGGVIPGVLYLITIKLCSIFYEVGQPKHPKEVDKERKIEAEAEAERRAEEAKERRKREREARDQRNYFTEDEDDVGQMPDINKLPFDDIKGAWVAENAEREEDEE